MVCGSCAARAAAIKAAKVKYVWTPPPGAVDSFGNQVIAVVYESEMAAKAKVLKRGGSYAPQV